MTDSARPLSGRLTRRIVVVLAAGVLASGAVALFGLDYAFVQVAFVLTWAIAGLGAALVVGQCGQISLGHGALLGIGAYAQALLCLHGMPAPLALPVAAALGAVGGWVASLPARRLGGLYFAMSTLAFGLLVEEAAVRWESLTNGAAGMAVPAFALAGWPADSPAAQAGVSLAAFVLAWTACRRLVASRVGRAWRAVREDEVAAAATGVDVARAKAQSFVAGGALAAFAGGLYAHWIAFLSPEQFGLTLSFELLMLVFIGGARRLSGALWGALVVVALPQLVALVAGALPPAVAGSAGLETLMFGTLLVVLVLLRPGGLARAE